MIDTHCHLTFPEFEGRVEEELAEAAALGVTGAITISTTTQDCLAALRLAETFDRVWCTAGVHPLYAHKGPHEWSNLAKVARSPRCVAWGELGLDNHYAEPPAAVQHAVLEEQLDFIIRCRKGDAAGAPGDPIDLPVVLHCREAFDDLIPILRRTPLDPSRFVFHCFTGSAVDARKVLDFGALISFTGVATYRNAKDVREAVKIVPLDRILAETDAPFLAPEPHRGRWPCRPAWVAHVAESLAATRGEPLDTLHAALNRNTERFFGIPAR